MSFHVKTFDFIMLEFLPSSQWQIFWQKQFGNNKIGFFFGVSLRKTAYKKENTDFQWDNISYVLKIIKLIRITHISNIKWCESITNQQSCNGVLLHCRLNQPLLSIWLELWPDRTLNCNYLVILLRYVIITIYTVFK